MDLTVVLAYLQTLAPWVHTLFVVLGGLATVGTVVDQVAPKVGLGKILSLPYLAPVFAALSKFSPFNFKS